MRTSSRLLTAGLLVMTGCTLEVNLTGDAPEAPSPAQEQYRIEFRGEDPATKSAYFPSTDRVQSAAAAVYRDGSLETVLRWDGNGQTDAFVMENSSVYSIYAVAGEVLTSQDFPHNESDLAQMTCRIWDSETDALLCRADGHTYIPMSASTGGTPEQMDRDDGTKDGIITLNLERLFAQVCFGGLTLDQEAARYFRVSGVDFSVWNNAREVYPFASKACGDVRPGPFDGEDFSEQEQARFAMVPENLQGNLLPYNDSPEKKTPESLTATGKNPDLATYVRVRVSFDTDYGVSGSGTYRFYLGDNDLTDFSVRRNTRYLISLQLTLDGMELKDNWKVEEVTLDDNRSIQLHGREAPVEPGGTIDLACEWTRDGTCFQDFTTDYGTAQGWSFGTAAQVDEYVSSGTSNNVTVTSGYAVRCPGCGTLFPNWPYSKDYRLQIAFLLRFCSGTIRRDKNCLRCGALVCSEAASDNSVSFAQEMSGLIEPCGIVTYTVPGDAQPWSVIPLYAKTFDGKVSDCFEIQVSSTSGNTYNWTGGRPTYVAQKRVLTATPSAGLRGLHFSPAPGSEDMIIVENASDGTDNNSCTVSCIGPGAARISVTGYLSSGGEVSCGDYSLSISVPRLAFSAQEYQVPLSGKFVPVDVFYAKPSGTPLEVETFDPELYASLLDPLLSIAEGSRLGPYLTLYGGSDSNDGKTGLELSKLSAGGRNIIYADFTDRSSFLRATPKAETLRADNFSDVPVKLADPFPDLNENVMLGQVDNTILLQGGHASMKIPHARSGSRQPGEKILFNATLNPLYDIREIGFTSAQDIGFEVHGDWNGYGFTPVLKSQGGTLTAGRKTVYLDIRNALSGEHFTGKAIGHVDIYLHAFFGACLTETYAAGLQGVTPQPPANNYAYFTESAVRKYPIPDYEVSFELQTGQVPELEALRSALSGKKFLRYKKRWTNNFLYGSDKDFFYMEKEKQARYTDGKEYVKRNIFTSNPYGYLDSMIVVGPTHRSYTGEYEIRNNSIEYSTDNSTLLNIQEWSCDYETVFTTHGLIRTFGEPVYAIRFGHWRQEHFWPEYGAISGDPWQCFCRDYYPTLRVEESVLNSCLSGVDVSEEGTRTYYLSGSPFHVICVGRDSRYTFSKWITPRQEFKY